MKKIIVIISIVIGFTSFGQETIIENDTIILWSKTRPLVWADFKGKTKLTKKENGIYTGALTAAGPVFVHQMDKNGNMISYPLTYFFKLLSSSISDDKLLLFHEQIHFDIAEVYTRKLRKSYAELIEDKIYESSVYSDLSNKIAENCAELQNEFDKEPSFSKTTQEKWRKRIDKELEELKEYEYYPE